VHETARARFFPGLEKLARGEDVDLAVIGIRVARGAVDRGHVHHRVAAGDEPPRVLGTAETPAHDLSAARLERGRDRLFAHERSHRIAAGEKPREDVASGVARGPGERDLHAASLRLSDSNSSA
jgi:hypothetical protein